MVRCVRLRPKRKHDHKTANSDVMVMAKQMFNLGTEMVIENVPETKPTFLVSDMLDELTEVFLMAALAHREGLKTIGLLDGENYKNMIDMTKAMKKAMLFICEYDVHYRRWAEYMMINVWNIVERLKHEEPDIFKKLMARDWEIKKIGSHFPEEHLFEDEKTKGEVKAE